MREARAIMSGVIKTGWQYRVAIILDAVYGPIYIIIFYFLWRAIFNTTPGGVINGMNFVSTITYLAVARVLLGLFNTSIPWKISSTVRDGSIILFLCSPVSFMFNYAARWLGGQLLTILMVITPNILFVCIFIPIKMHFTIVSLLFIPSLLLGMAIGFMFDFIVGTIAFYTEAVYGVVVGKKILMEFFSGQLIPIILFPKFIRKITMILPFQAVINTPVSILTNPDMGMEKALSMVLIQLLWAVGLVLFASIFFRRASRKVTVNGG